MKHTLLYLATLVLTLTSCSDFLERTSQNQVVPTTVEQYKEMLQGSNGYFYNAPVNYAFVNLMTDDVTYADVSDTGVTESPAESSSLQPYRLAYQWADEIENDDFMDNAFNYLYSQVLVANTTLDKIDLLTDPTGEREILRGQALFHRAFGYFTLATLYGPVYNLAQADAPCVPLKLEPVPSTDPFFRATVAQVWGQIREDISTGLKSMEGSRIINTYELNYNALLVLGVRVALEMEDYDTVIAYGEELLKAKPDLYDITAKTSGTDENSTSIGGPEIMNFISDENPEIVWLFGGRTTFLNMLGGLSDNNVYYYTISKSLTDLYTKGLKEGQTDRRLNYFFLPPGRIQGVASQWYNYTLLKYDYNDGLFRSQALRTGEVYLSLAEAYARKASPDANKALGYINDLRAKRIHNYTALSLSDIPSGAAGLVEFIWEERRRELCGEELHRWWDLRRTGQPQIEHPWKDNTKYVLQAKDKGYVLNFPLLERQSNAHNYNERPHRQAVPR